MNKDPSLSGSLDAASEIVVPNSPTSDDQVDLELQKDVNSYDQTLKQIGVGRFQWALLLLCGWANAADAVEIIVISFTLPATAKELHLTDKMNGLLTSVIFIGMMFGGWIWGTYADLKGRRQTLMLSMFVNFLFAFISGFSVSFEMLAIFRFLSGLGVGGSIPVVFSYFCEFLPPAHRGKFLSYLAAFWMVGSIMCAGMAWGIIPPGTIQGVSSWRFFLWMAALPSFLVSICVYFAPESPRYLLTVNRYDEAMIILEHMYRVNHPGKELRDATGFRHIEMADYRSQPTEINARNIPLMIKAFFKSSKDLFTTSKLLRFNTLKLLVIWITLCYGYYGLFLWLPLYFGTIPQLDIYLSSFLVALANLPGNIISALLVDWLGRTKLLAASMCIAGASVAAIPFVTQTWQVVLMSCIFSGASTPGWNALDIVSAELFPTHLRGTGFGVLTFAGRVAAIVADNTFGLFSGTSRIVPLLITAGMLITGGLCALTLPELKGAAID